MNPWWTDHAAGLIGAVAGSVNGLLGGLIGAVAGIFTPQGRFRRLVLGLMSFALVMGIASLAVGLVALALHQPYAVWYPLVLLGVMNTPLWALFIPMVRQAYRQADARRLEAEDLRRS